MTSLRAVGCVVLLSSTASADARLELFDVKGNLVYLGSEQERVDGDGLERIVRYCHLDGRLVFESRARFDASRRVVSIRMQDRQSGKSPAMKVSDDAVIFTGKDKTTTVARPAELHVSEGIEDLVRSRWQTLSSGSPVAFEMAITQHARTLRFRLVREREDGVAMVLRLEPSLWVLRKLAEPVCFHVEKKAPHRVVETRGPSAVTDAAGELQVLRAVYARSDPRPLPCANQ